MRISTSLRLGLEIDSSSKKIVGYILTGLRRSNNKTTRYSVYASVLLRASRRQHVQCSENKNNSPSKNLIR